MANIQKAGVLAACRTVYSNPDVARETLRLPVPAGLRLGLSPSGSSPMLSGDRLTTRARGMTISHIARPDIRAAVRQPMVNTTKAISGVITRPPTALPVETKDIARPFLLMNQVLIEASMAWL